MVSAIINITKLFLHLILNRNTGQSTFKQIQALHKQLKANVASVPSTLGGGRANNHLGLILLPQAYIAIDPGATND